MKFDRKTFLAARLNGGQVYCGVDGTDDIDCGCIKGNFAFACGGFRSTALYMQNDLARIVPKVQTALDIAEVMLISGHPQKAKLFFDLMVEKYNILEGLEQVEVKGGFELLDERKVITLKGGYVDTLVARKFTPAVAKVKTRLLSVV